MGFIIFMILLIKVILYPLLVLYGAFAVFAYRNLNRILKKVAKFRKNQELQIDPEWQGFVRNDFGKWDVRSMKIGCFTRFPFKLMVILFYVITIAIVVVVTAGFKKMGKKIQKYFVKYVGDLALWSFLTIDQRIEVNHQSPIIISNHVSWIDIVYLTQRIYPLAIVSKETIAHAPIIGTIAKDIQCLFILRESEDARKDIMEKIQKRVSDYNQGQSVNQLLIFPEGTTSNGKGLLKFKIGAFASKPKITIFGLIYECQGFSMGMDQITTFEHFIISLCMKPKLTVKTTTIEPKDNEEPNDYMLRCQKKMSQLTSFKCYNSSHAERNIFKEMRENSKQE